jgi:diguanylate cyclase (GGDEF)-like protein
MDLAKLPAGHDVPPVYNPTAFRRARAEGDLIYVRWVCLAAATLYLLFAAHVQNPLPGWIAVIAGAVVNAALVYLRLRGRFSLALSIAVQGSEIVLLILYTTALQGGVARHLGLYTTMVILATLRFGVWGALGSSGLLLIAGLVAWAAFPEAALLANLDFPPPAQAIGILVTDAALLAYFAYLDVCQGQIWRREQERLKGMLSDLSVLYEVSSAAHDLRSEDALQSIVEIVTQVLGHRRAALFLVDDMQELVPNQYHSAGETSSRIVLASALREQILKQGAPLVIDGSQSTADMSRGPIVQIAVPLHGDQGPLGVLMADCSERPDASRLEIEMLTSLAKSAVVVIENARLHQRIKQMANRDGVTGLYNHRYFQERLREMLAAAAAVREPVSLLMIDLDRFKQYNDTLGHRQGDAALLCFARALLDCTRAWDALVARYGGDEFVVVLPRMGRDQALAVARVVLGQVYQQAAQALAERGLPPVTASIGVATDVVDAHAAEELIEAADRAMYAVKHDGGNRVHAYTEPIFTQRRNI